MGNEYSEAERERIVVHGAKLETIEMVLMRLEAKVDAWQANFVSKEMLEEKLKARDERINRIENEKVTHKNNMPAWVAAAVAIVSLIISFWPHMK